VIWSVYSVNKIHVALTYTWTSLPHGDEEDNFLQWTVVELNTVWKCEIMLAFSNLKPRHVFCHHFSKLLCNK